MKYKKPQTRSERQANYEKRHGIKKIRCRTKRGDAKTRWKDGYFIAIDGEGESFGMEEKIVNEENGSFYLSKDHKYTLLAASTGESLFRNNERLKTFDCIDFLLDISDENKLASFVVFAGGYDFNHMLLFSFDKDQLKNIVKKGVEVIDSQGKKHFERCIFAIQKNGVDYEIEYRPRKSFTVRRGLEWKETNKGIKKVWKSKIIVWDVWGFFQDSFVGVIDKWLGKDYMHYDFIKEMKEKRNAFSDASSYEIQRYNECELDALVKVMNKVKGAIDGLGLKLKRWDGAGAVAAAMFDRHGIKKHMGEQRDRELMNAVRTAFAGGRIEVCKIGVYEGPVYDYDINSAYPFVMNSLPCLACGRWVAGDGEPPPGFTLVHVKYKFPDDSPFYPFFYRTKQMEILFPCQGEGIYWYPEYYAALEHPLGMIDVIKWWHYVIECDHRPFAWIEEYYHKRQSWVKNPSEDWQRGGEKIIKLGLNSLYGKTAQQIGSEGNKPPYHQLEWAGYITSSTRARLYQAAIKNPDSIIGFATDGIFSNAPLDLVLSDKKEFGAWELKTPIPQGIVIAMAGVYWWKYDDENYQHFSRGFDKEFMKKPANVIAAWKKGLSKLDVKLTRLIGIGSACASETFWKIRGRFVEGVRVLALDGDSNKRLPIDVKKEKPHEKLVNLLPRPNIAYLLEDQGCSFIYPIRWLDGEYTDEYMSDMEMTKELIDGENA